MGSYIQIFALVLAGIILLWIGYSIFFGSMSPFYPLFFPSKKKAKGKNEKGKAGDPQVCPICSTKMIKGQLVKSVAFPSLSGGKDRLMYIRGCYACLNDNLPRKCPVCGVDLSIKDYLVSRMFERSNRKDHVHILGCNKCKKMGKLKM